MNKFGDNILMYRKRKQYSQEVLADEINQKYKGRKKSVSYSSKAISKWERGESFPPIDVVVFLAEIMGLSLDQLFKEEINEVQFFLSFSRDNSTFTYEEKEKIVDAIDHINFLVLKESERTWEYQSVYSKIVTIGCEIEKKASMCGEDEVTYQVMEYNSELEAKSRANEFDMLPKKTLKNLQDDKEYNEVVIKRWIANLNSCIERQKKKDRDDIKEGKEIIYHKKKLGIIQAVGVFRRYFERYNLPHEKIHTDIEVKEIPDNPLCLEVKIIQRFLLTKEELAQMRGELSKEVEHKRLCLKLGRMKGCDEDEIEIFIQNEKERRNSEYQDDYDRVYYQYDDYVPDELETPDYKLAEQAWYLEEPEDFE